MQFRVACTLRLYVKQLRSLRSLRPGTVDDGYAQGPAFNGYEYGPCPDVLSYRRFFDLVSYQGWLTRVNYSRYNSLPFPKDPPSSLSNWETVVFSHGDLNMTNMILDKKGSLWVIDWDASGFHPVPLEAMAMRIVDDPSSRSGLPVSWIRYRDFIVGKVSEDDVEYWANLKVGLDKFVRYR